jgi:hypothetical protein
VWSVLDVGTLVLTLACLVIVFAPVLVEAPRLLRRLPRRDAVHEPLAPDADVEDVVAHRLYGHRTGSPAVTTSRRHDHAYTATRQALPRTRTHGPGRLPGSEPPARIPRRRARPRR